MAYNVFVIPQTEYQLLTQEYPALITIAFGGASLARKLSTWDTASLGLVERLAYAEFRIVDKVYAIFRDSLGVEGRRTLQELRQGWRALWLASVRQIPSNRPSRTLQMVDDGGMRLDSALDAFRISTTPNDGVRGLTTHDADEWLDIGRALILSLRETEARTS